MSDPLPESYDPVAAGGSGLVESDAQGTRSSDLALDELTRKRLPLAMVAVLGFIIGALPIELHYDPARLAPYLELFLIEVGLSVLTLLAVRYARGYARGIAAAWAGVIGVCVALYYPIAGGDATLAMIALTCLVSAVPALIPVGPRQQMASCALCWLGLLVLFVLDVPSSLPWPFLFVAFLAVTTLSGLGARSLDHFRREALRREWMLRQTHEDLRLALGRAQEAIAMRSRMIASVSHEFRTPVNVIVGYADMLLDPAVAADSALGLVQRIRENAVALDALVSQLLDYSRLSCGKVEVGREEIDVPSLLDEVAQGARLLVRDKAIGVLVECEAGRLRSDPMRLRQILHNLVANAARFTERGRIEIRASGELDRIVFEVSDTGCGIPEGKQKDIFTAFEQLDNGYGNRGGIGLGLAIVRQLTDLLGGEIEVKSEAGVGSTFTVVLPDALSSEPAREAAETPSAAA